MKLFLMVIPYKSRYRLMLLVKDWLINNIKNKAKLNVFIFRKLLSLLI